MRLGGIYALEQIAKESKELHPPVTEILTAFLRGPQWEATESGWVCEEQSAVKHTGGAGAMGSPPARFTTSGPC